MRAKLVGTRLYVAMTICFLFANGFRLLYLFKVWAGTCLSQHDQTSTPLDWRFPLIMIFYMTDLPAREIADYVRQARAEGLLLDLRQGARRRFLTSSFRRIFHERVRRSGCITCGVIPLSYQKPNKTCCCPAPLPRLSSWASEAGLLQATTMTTIPFWASSLIPFLSKTSMPVMNC